MTILHWCHRGGPRAEMAEKRVRDLRAEVVALKLQVERLRRSGRNKIRHPLPERCPKR